MVLASLFEMKNVGSIFTPISHTDKSPNDRRLSAILRQAVVLPFILVALLATAFVWQINYLVRVNKWVDKADNIIAQANESGRFLSEMQTNLLEFLLTGHAHCVAELAAANTANDASLKQLRAAEEDPRQMALLDQLADWRQLWRSYVDRQVQNKTSGRDYLGEMNTGRELMNSIRANFLQFVEGARAARDLRSLEARTASRWVVVTTVATALILAWVLAYFTRRLILSLARDYALSLETVRRNAHELKASKDALHDSEEQLKGIIQSAQDAIVCVRERDQTICIFNQAAERMFQCHAEVCLGTNPEPFIPENVRDQFKQRLAAFFHAESTPPEMYHLTALRSNGETFPIEATLAKVGAGGERMITAVIRDVSERVKAEDEREASLEREKRARALAESAERDAMEANRAKDEFLATLSHELRTPLTAILGWVRLVRSGKLSLEKMAHGLEVIERNARLQAELIEDLLDVSRIVTGKLKLNMHLFLVSPLVEAAVETVRPAAKAKKIDIRTMLMFSTRRVLGDGNRLQQVLWSLLANALKFTPSGGLIDVQFRELHDHVEIRVIDTGRGISAEFLPRVFDRFRQADSSSTREQGGLGIGLAIVRHLIELHGGTVRAESKGEGQGATFIIVLPLSKDADFRVPRPVHQGVPVPRRKTARSLARPDRGGRTGFANDAGTARRAVDAGDLG